MTHPRRNLFPSLRAGSAEYEEWMDAVYTAIESRGITRSDAQGIAEVQAFEVARQWGLGAQPSVAAGIILAEAPEEPSASPDPAPPRPRS